MGNRGECNTGFKCASHFPGNHPLGDLGRQPPLQILEDGMMIVEQDKMKYHLIVSQGRIGDREDGAIKGAALLAQAIATETGLENPAPIGSPSPARKDDWRDCLPQARETLQALQAAVSGALENGKVPLLVANTCAASLATLPVAAATHPDAVVLWIDAHGDFNTPEVTQTGYLGGMVLAAACGLWQSGHGAGLNPARIVIAGARDIDTAEDELLRRHGVTVLAPAASSPEKIRAAIGAAPVWVHIDWDALEPGYVPADYSVPDGLLPADLRDILAAIPAAQIAGVELAEFNASGDHAADAVALAGIFEIIAPLFAARCE